VSEQWRSRIIGRANVSPSNLTANPKNWRKHPKAQTEALAAVLSEVGWVQDVIVNKLTGHILDGHARIELALERAEPSVPVVYVDLSDEEEALILATFDPLSGMALTDKAKLDALFAELSNQTRLIGVLGHFRSMPHDGLTDPDAIPTDVPTRTKHGDLWLLGEHRLLCGDSTNAEDVTRLMNGQNAALMATDPPYLVDYQGDNHPQSWHNKPSVRDKHWDDYRDPDQAGDFFFAFIDAALPHLLPDAAVYQWHANLRQSIVEASWARAGLHLHQVIIWVKARPVLTRSHYMWQHEPALYGWLKGNQPKRKPPANAHSVWQINQQGESDGIHPTQKPVEISARPIEYHTPLGGLCYEPFSGSGTTIIAAERLGRRCYAMEIEPRYVDVAVRRWEEYTGRQAECVRTVSESEKAPVTR
jgi:DNA modification methylase